jgi:hypothetical protein
MAAMRHLRRRSPDLRSSQHRFGEIGGNDLRAGALCPRQLAEISGAASKVQDSGVCRHVGTPDGHSFPAAIHAE